MIIWLASYPKSGNTWVRSLLSAYLYSKDGIFNFDLLNKIRQFPSNEYFNFFLKGEKEFNNVKKVSDYWIAAQDRINLINDEINFLKTHSALCTLEKNPFTNKINTKAVIYIVRDPRNLVTSFSHHYSMNIEESYNYIINEKKMLTENEYGTGDRGVVSILGSWPKHYESWKNIKFAPILIVKYENLIGDTKNSFMDILNFLSKFTKIKIDEKKILNTINSCTFEKMVEKEKKEGFRESAISKKDNKKLNFFYLGKKNDWRNLLSPEIEKNLREVFFKEMKELGYI